MGVSARESVRQNLTARGGKATVEKRGADSMDDVGVASDLGGDGEFGAVLRGRLLEEQRKLEKQKERGEKSVQRRQRKDHRSGGRWVYGGGRHVQTKGGRKREIGISGSEIEER